PTFCFACLMCNMLLLLAICTLRDKENLSDCTDEFKLHGDYIIGGLFPVHYATKGLYLKYKPDAVDCQEKGLKLPFYKRGYMHLQALRFAVEEINNSSSLLPSITLGYDLFDDCYEAAGIMATFSFLSANLESNVKIQKDYISYQSKVIAVIGPMVSDTAVTTSSILSYFMVPQISYTASTEALSNKRIFQSFLRSFPSGKHQAQAMVLLLKKFQWNWIIVVGSDTEYGRSGKQSIVQLAAENGICVAYHKSISDTGSKITDDITEVINVSIKQNVKVILIFSEVPLASGFFKEIIKSNIIGRVWIGSSVWATDRSIYDMTKTGSIGTVFGIAAQPGRMDGFDFFVTKALYDQSKWINDSTMGICNKFCEECKSLVPEDFINIPEKRESFRVYSAVHAVAHSLHQLLDCDSGSCQKSVYFPWQLLEKVKQVNFSLHDKLINFDERGEVPTGYDVVLWNWTTGEPSFDTIGEYSARLKSINIHSGLIDWHTEGNTIPVSVCSEDCLPGQKRKQAGPYICCFYCLTCPEGTYINKSNLYECQPCDKDQWAPEGSPLCYQRTVEYLSWTIDVSIALISISTIGLFLTVGVGIIFIINRDTPVVKAAGGKLCLPMLTSLTCCFCSIYFFIGKPSLVTCILRQLLFPVSYTACLSCLLLRSFQIMCIFKMAARLPVSFDYWVKHNGQYMFICIVTAIQVFLCSFWIGIGNNEPLFVYRFKDAIVLKCGEYTALAIISEVAYTGLLSALCFIFSYTGEELPKNYNEAKCITFTMLIYFISVICYFMFDKAQSERNSTMWMVICILARLYGVLGGYYFPKCYVILFKPMQNTTAFFQACLQDYNNRKSSI
uniref:G-protein coupled receptors family 3 profile domain-containing protein n=1 Tax=Latimeria chalumnae TaxID=7897 RepID=H3BHP4_LATCH